MSLDLRALEAASVHRDTPELRFGFFAVPSVARGSIALCGANAHFLQPLCSSMRLD